MRKVYFEDNIKEKLKEFYESSKYGVGSCSILIGQYGTNGYEIRDPSRFMVIYNGQLKEIISMIPSGKDVLDVGVGDGVIAGLLLKDAKSLTGLDISAKRVEKCAETYKDGCFIVGNAEELPFKEESFDIIIASELIEHLIEPEKFLISSHRVLRKSGTLIISTPSALFYENNLTEVLKDQHLHTFSPRSLKSILKRTGFKPVEIKGLGFKLRIKIPKLLGFLLRVFYAIITQKKPKRGFIAPVSIEWSIISNKFLNRLYLKNEVIYRKIFSFLSFIGKNFPSLSSQVVIRAEKVCSDHKSS